MLITDFFLVEYIIIIFYVVCRQEAIKDRFESLTNNDDDVIYNF